MHLGLGKFGKKDFSLVSFSYNGDNMPRNFIGEAE